MIGSVLFAPTKTAPINRLRRWTVNGQAPQEIGVSRLGVFELFRSLDTEAIEEIAHSARERMVPGGTRIIRQGQVGNEIFLLEKGEVGILSEGNDVTKLIHVLREPSIFGEMAVVNRERIRTASVEAISDVKLLVIPIADLLVYLKRFAVLRNNLRRIIAERSPQ